MSAVVVVGFSVKPEGRAALDHALAEAELRGARLVVVPNTEADGPEAEKALLAITRVEHRVTEPSELGRFAEHLLGVAEREGAELVIIGLRRRSPTGKLLLGLNAQRVLLDAGVPVMAVKAP